jgi:hypothetical protein
MVYFEDLSLAATSRANKHDTVTHKSSLVQLLIAIQHASHIATEKQSVHVSSSNTAVLQMSISTTGSSSSSAALHLQQL